MNRQSLVVNKGEIVCSVIKVRTHHSKVTHWFSNTAVLAHTEAETAEWPIT